MQCSGASSLFMQESPHWCARSHSWFWWTRSGTLRLVLGSGTKSEVVSVFCHRRIPQLSLDSCGLPLTVLWRWLFLNKWVYDSDFLLPLLSLSLIWNSTHPSERAQSCCCRSRCFTCATWLGGSVSPPFEKPVATPIFNRAWIFVQILH